MNEAAANALYEAERRGVKQIKGDFRDGQGGRCGLGVLGFPVHNLQQHKETVALFGLRMDTPMDCPLCGKARPDECGLITHLNDEHSLTFSEIARKLGPDAA